MPGISKIKDKKADKNINYLWVRHNQGFVLFCGFYPVRPETLLNTILIPVRRGLTPSLWDPFYNRSMLRRKDSNEQSSIKEKTVILSDHHYRLSGRDPGRDIPADAAGLIQSALLDFV